ncbi:MAG TPA: HAMP domain-containing sensor histidine kinase [Candidatus Krumholzibacteria bacterium]|jgi:signal transduction histidine kinase
MSLAEELRGSTLRSILKSYLLVGIVLIAISIAIFTIRVSGDIDRQAELTTRLIGELLADAIVKPATSEEMVRHLRPIRDAVAGVDFPFIITDPEGHPFLWNAQQTGVEIPEELGLAELLAADLEKPNARTERLLMLVADFDAEREPIALHAGGAGELILRLHYGRSRLSRRVLWMPVLEGVLIVSFMGIALAVFRMMKRGEQRSLWVGMAKETAHQMGTPLTSLNGWLALLDDREALSRSGELSESEVLDEIGSDVDRLAKVSARFSQIGSNPVRKPGRADRVARRVCTYFRRRLPHLARQVELREEIEELPETPLVEELLDWALENLVKNALDASDKDHGVVIVRCRHLPKRGRVLIEVEDDGRGMSPATQRRLFDPGFTTKERGWGMGLVLTHRIVTEYHGGSIGVRRSGEGEGTVMRILLPTQ